MIPVTKFTYQKLKRIRETTFASNSGVGRNHLSSPLSGYHAKTPANKITNIMGSADSPEHVSNIQFNLSPIHSMYDHLQRNRGF